MPPPIKGVRRLSQFREAKWLAGHKRSCRTAQGGIRDTFVVVGFVPAPAGRSRAIYLARREGRALVHAGKAGTAFTGESARASQQKLDPIAIRKSSLTQPMKKPKGTWVKPQVLADIEYRAITADGRMRHGSFKGVRDD
jgi:bifunctional non-homologous end joining protein LigD